MHYYVFFFRICFFKGRMREFYYKGIKEISQTSFKMFDPLMLEI